jgi:hypothetical protein
MSQMLDDQFDDQLQDAVRDYNSPPETPREEMWARIEAVRKEGGNEGTTFRLLRWPAAIAALLALGIGLGRLSAPRPEAGAPPATAAVSPRTDDMAYRLVTTEHLGQSEAFLTLFRASVRRGGSEQIASATARQLLATNRLLLDSPAAKDDKIRLLLQDLELVLAQIAQLSPRPSSPDLDLITEGLEDGGVMSRLRTAVPSGTSTTQGVL